MARSVSDAAYILNIISGKDIRDNYTLAQPWECPPDYTQSLDFSSLRGARIGIPRNALYAFDLNEAVLDAFDDAIQIMKNAGAIIVDNTNFTAWDAYMADEQAVVGNGSIVLYTDFVSNIATYLSELTSNPNNIYNLMDLLSFTHNYPQEDYPDRNTDIWQASLALGYNNTDFRAFQAEQYTRYFGSEGGVLGALETYELDALILPTDVSPELPAAAGLPVVTVPMGFYPSNTSVQMTDRGLVEVGPNIPFVFISSSLYEFTNSNTGLDYHSLVPSGQSSL
jgi:amidase